MGKKREPTAEERWLSDEESDSYEMIDVLKGSGHADPRKLRLFACALGRMMWDAYETCTTREFAPRRAAIFPCDPPRVR